MCWHIIKKKPAHGQDQMSGENPSLKETGSGKHIFDMPLQWLCLTGMPF
jgi:hypothetical protein